MSADPSPPRALLDLWTDPLERCVLVFMSPISQICLKIEVNSNEIDVFQKFELSAVRNVIASMSIRRQNRKWFNFRTALLASLFGQK